MLPNIVRVRGDEMGTSRTLTSTPAYKVLVRKPKGRRPLEKPTSKSEDNIKMDLIYEGWNFNSGNYLFTTDTK